MGRPAGSKNKPKAITVENEFMPGRTGSEMTERTDEPEPETLQAFAASILSNPAYRESLKQRATTGKLTTSESKLLVELGTREAETPKEKSGVDLWVTYATTGEVRMMARVARRALGRPDADDPVRKYVTKGVEGQEIVTWK